MKKLILCLLILATLLSAVSCNKRNAMNSPEKKFEGKDISITLTTGFRESRVEGYEACYEASDMTVYVIKEDYENLTDEQKNLSVVDYANLVRANNISKNPQKVNEKNNLVFFESTYTGDIDGVAYKTFTSLYKTANAFWAVQFCCEEAIYEDYTEKIIAWAQSVFFTLKNLDYTVNDMVISLAEGFNPIDMAEFNTSNRIIDRSKDHGEQYVTIYRSFNRDSIINFKREGWDTSQCANFATYYEQVYEKYKGLEEIKKLKKCTALSVEDNWVFFEIEHETPIDPISGKSTSTIVSYLVACYAGTDAFWTLEFGCTRANYSNYKETFKEWAESVTFTQPEA